MIRYGIPPYRLPHDIIDAEVKRITDLGVEIQYNTAIGRDMPFEDLKNEYDAVFFAIGAHKGLKLRVEGEDAPNVYTGVEYLNKVNSGEPPDIGDKVIVIGGGDTAIDAARVSKRLGANATILYRRTRTEMPAIEEEIEEALKESIPIEYLAAPIEILKNGEKVKALKCIRMELGEPDDSGRRRPVPIEGSEYVVECTAVISAISQEPDYTGLDQFHHGRDWTKVDEKGQTEFEGVFAGGDVLDLGWVTGANYQGRKAADAIDVGFRNMTFEKEESKFPPVVTTDKMKLEVDVYQKSDRTPVTMLPVEERFGALDKEVVKTYTPDEAVTESKRCLSCGMCFNCERCWMYCQVSAVVKTDDIDHPFAFKLELCDGCKKCEEECPCGYIVME
jgi:formate dehydrogenase major subunit